MHISFTVTDRFAGTRVALIKALRAVSGCTLVAAKHTQEEHFPFTKGYAAPGSVTLRVDPARAFLVLLGYVQLENGYTLPAGIKVAVASAPRLDLTTA